MRVRDDAAGWWCITIARNARHYALLKGGQRAILQEQAERNPPLPLVRFGYELRHLGQSQFFAGPDRDDWIVFLLRHVIQPRLSTDHILAGKPFFRVHIAIRRTGLQHVQVCQPRVLNSALDELDQVPHMIGVAATNPGKACGKREEQGVDRRLHRGLRQALCLHPKR